MTRLTAFAVLVLARTVLANPVADSVADYSTMQTGQWRYGFAIGDAGMPPPGVATFTEFGTVSAGQWKATAAQVGSQNTTFLNLSSSGGHPAGLGPGSQDAIVWPIRRYTTAVGSLSFVYEFQNNDTQPFNASASGTTAHVFVDGVQIALHTSRNDQDVPKAPPFIVLDAGAVVDFAADPHGVAPFPENEYSARADGFSWRVRAYVYPCSGNSDCGGTVKCIASVCCDPAVLQCADAGTGTPAIDAGQSPSDAGGSTAPDAGPIVQVDAGLPMPSADSGVVVPVFDAGTKPPVIDAGVPGGQPLGDAGSLRDGGTGGSDKVLVEQGGCGCTSGSGGFGLLALGLVWVWRARKSR